MARTPISIKSEILRGTKGEFLTARKCDRSSPSPGAMTGRDAPAAWLAECSDGRHPSGDRRRIA